MTWREGFHTLEIALRATVSRAHSPSGSRAKRPIHLFLAITDHFEPHVHQPGQHIARQRLEHWLREYPRIDEPVVTVNTRLIGASSEVIESQVTKPLEDSIAGIDGVDIITSISRAEQSQISVRFKLEKSPDNAAADVRVELVLDQGRALVTGRVVDHQRLVRPVEDRAELRPHVAAQVERLAGEPVAAVLRRIVAIEREALRLRARRRKREAAREQQQK